jgi:hypothetical protein
MSVALSHHALSKLVSSLAKICTQNRKRENWAEYTNEFMESYLVPQKTCCYAYSHNVHDDISSSIGNTNTQPRLIEILVLFLR